jgi:uroporphyrinogen decarboxylase
MALPEMSHWDRIKAALQGEETDRPPFCLWRHWPIEDQTAEALADVMSRWQQEYDCDLVKHAPAGSYVVEDWGGRTTYVPENSRGLGVRTITRRAVTATEQWPELAQLDVSQGHLGMQLEAVRLATQKLEGSVPLLQTVFSPLNIAPKLAGDLAFTDLRENPELFSRGLQVIAETTARFAQESLRAGADGILFVSPCNPALFSEDEYRAYGVPYDRIILDSVREEAQIIMVLLLGQEIMFDLVAQYPVDALNWPDRICGPSLQDAQERFPGLLMGGIDERQTLLNGPASAIEAEIKDAIAQTGGRRLLVGPGSTPFIDTPTVHFRAARDAM